jgi:hypothetical protein
MGPSLWELVAQKKEKKMDFFIYDDFKWLANWISGLLSKNVEWMFGALLTALVGFLFARWQIYIQNKLEIRRNIEIEAAREVLELIEEMEKILNKIWIWVFELKIDIKGYNNKFHSNLNTAYNYFNIPRKLHNEHVNLFSEYTEKNTNYYFKLNANKVILNKMWGIQNYLYQQYREFNDLYCSLGVRLIKIENQISNNTEIENIELELFEKIITKINDINVYNSDFIIELQNEYIGKIINYKIQRRKILTNELKVLKSGMKYEIINEKINKE